MLRDDRPLRLVSESIANGCDDCSRRGALYRVAAETRVTVLALGPTADDRAKSRLRNICSTGAGALMESGGIGLLGFLGVAGVRVRQLMSRWRGFGNGVTAVEER